MEELFTSDEQRPKKEIRELRKEKIQKSEVEIHELIMKIEELRNVEHFKDLKLKKLIKEHADKEEKHKLHLARMREKLPSGYNEKLNDLKKTLSEMTEETNELMDKIVEAHVVVDELEWWG